MSLPEDPDRTFAGTTLTLRIIVGSMVAGLTFFMAIAALVLRPQMAKQPPAAGAAAGAAQPGGGPTLPVITVVALTMAVTAVPLSFVVPRLVSDAARKQIAAGSYRAPTARGATPPATDADRLALVYQTRTIIAAALCEGTGFLAAMAYALEGQVIALVLALGLIAAVAAKFPPRGAIANWVEEQLARLELDRREARSA